MVISVVERSGRMHTSAADKAHVRVSGRDVTIIFSGAGKVLGTLALAVDEACLLAADLDKALGASGPSKVGKL